MVLARPPRTRRVFPFPIVFGHCPTAETLGTTDERGWTPIGKELDISQRAPREQYQRLSAFIGGFRNDPALTRYWRIGNMRTVSVILITWLFVLPAQAQYSGGSGTADDPYQIAMAADLIALGETPDDHDKHFILTADINLDPNLPGRKVFDKAVIAPYLGCPFEGVFDGNGHTISHLTIAGESLLGLFGRLESGASILNVGLEAVEVSGTENEIGGLAGSSSGIISTSFSTGALRGGKWVGGLVGSNSGSVFNCYSTTAVSGIEEVGGLVGITTGNVFNCYSAGVVSALQWAGGIYGMFQSYTAGDTRWNGVSPVANSFWDAEVNGRPAGGISKTTIEMQDIQTYLDSGWDFVGESENGASEIWSMPPERGYPRLARFSGHTPPQLQGQGTPDEPYLISSALELGAMAWHPPGCHYRLVSPIDLTGIHWGMAVIPYFAGTFDGNDLAVSSLIMDGPGYLGLFGRVDHGGKVKNLGVVDVNIAGWLGNISGLVAHNSGAVSRCYVSGLIEGFAFTGALAGENDGTVTGSHSIGAVIGESYIGGLVGGNWGQLTDCYSAGEIDGSFRFVGGLLGWNAGDVSHCYNLSTVSGEWWGIGGLVGINTDDGTITASYNTGAVNAETIVGGLVGSNRGSVSGCYSTGSTSGDDSIGGLLGYNSGTVTQCHSSAVVNGDFGVGGLAGANSGSVLTSFSAGTAEGDERVGGLVGKNSGSVVSSYSTCTVNGGQFVGGLVGQNFGNIKASCSSGTVTGGQNVGGLAGLSGHHLGGQTAGTVIDCYSTSPVSGVSGIGGLVGNPGVYTGGATVSPGRRGHCRGIISSSYSVGTVSYSTEAVPVWWQTAGGLIGSATCQLETNSFWDIQTSGWDTSAGGIGLTTAEMQSTGTFLEAGWDFVDETENGTNDVWWILEGLDYPRLRWEGYAFLPDPPDGAIDVPRSCILDWMAATRAAGHDVYFGDDEEAVTIATTDTLAIYGGRQPWDVTTYYPGILEWGLTYYWRVDEVNEAYPDSPWKGNVWSFAIVDAVHSPYPPDGASDAIQPMTLSWVPGGPGLEYDVYVGEDEHAVATATVEDVDVYFGRQQSDMTTFEADDLECNQTYYWRVDGVDEADPNSPYKGDVWSFTTADYLVVSIIDDFDSYSREGMDPAVWQVWIDGVDDPNNGGSQVGYMVPPFVELTIVHGGHQSMPLFYDNDGTAHDREGVPFYSECVRTWGTSQDWTVDDADTLTLYFHGEPGNDPRPLYVRIEDTAGSSETVTHLNADAVLATEWQKWHIPLADLQADGVDVRSVRKMIIGIGDRDNP